MVWAGIVFLESSKTVQLDEQTIAIIQYFFDTLYGATVIFLLAGVPASRKNIGKMAVVTCLCFSLVVFGIVNQGLDRFSRFYALFVHVPFAVYFVLGFRRSVPTALLALFLSYFAGAPRFLFGYLSVGVFSLIQQPIDPLLAKRIGWMVTGPLMIWPVYKLFIPPFRDLIAQAASGRPYLLVLIGSSYVLAQVIFGTIGQGQILWSQLFILFLIAFLVSLVGYSRKQRQLENVSAKMVAYSVQNEGLSLYTDALAGYLQDTARLRHDQHHILTMLDLHASRGDLPAVRQLLADSLAVLASPPGQAAGNNIVDAMVLLFRKRAAEHGVTIELGSQGLPSLPLPENDLCLLLSNCIDNAIEATRQAPAGQRTIHLTVLHNRISGSSSLVVRNPCHAPPSFAEDGLPRSTKGPGHGFGTSSMQTIVKKNGGVCGFSVENGMFIFRATFLPAKTAASLPATLPATASVVSPGGSGGAGG